MASTVKPAGAIPNYLDVPYKPVPGAVYTPIDIETQLKTPGSMYKRQVEAAVAYQENVKRMNQKQMAAKARHLRLARLMAILDAVLDKPDSLSQIQIEKLQQLQRDVADTLDAIESSPDFSPELVPNLQHSVDASLPDLVLAALDRITQAEQLGGLHLFHTQEMVADLQAITTVDALQAHAARSPIAAAVLARDDGDVLAEVAVRVLNVAAVEPAEQPGFGAQNELAARMADFMQNRKFEEVDRKAAEQAAALYLEAKPGAEPAPEHKEQIQQTKARNFLLGAEIVNFGKARELAARESGGQLTAAQTFQVAKLVTDVGIGQQNRQRVVDIMVANNIAPSLGSEDTIKRLNNGIDRLDDAATNADRVLNHADKVIDHGEELTSKVIATMQPPPSIQPRPRVGGGVKKFEEEDEHQRGSSPLSTKPGGGGVG